MARDAVYLLVGEETYRKDEFIKNTKSRYLPDPQRDLDFSSVSAQKTSIDDILATSMTPPFLGKKRLIVIRDVEKLSSRDKELLIAHLRHLPKTTCLVLESGKTVPADRFLGILATHATVIKAEQVAPAAVGQWIRKKIAPFGKTISGGAVELLKELTGNNLQVLSTEVDKILSFIGEKEEIAAGDVEAIVGRSLKEDVFLLVDYISRKDLKEALLLGRRLMAQGKKAHEILGLLGWYLRKSLVLKRERQHGGSPEALLRKFGYRRFYAERFIAILNNFNTGEIKEKLKLLAEADRALKTSTSKPGIVLDIVLSRLCAT